MLLYTKQKVAKHQMGGALGYNKQIADTYNISKNPFGGSKADSNTSLDLNGSVYASQLCIA